MDPQPAQNGRQEIASRLLMVTMLFLFMNGPGNQVPAGNGFSARDHALERIVRSRRSLDILNTTRWQDFAPVGRKTPGRNARLSWMKGDEGLPADGFVGQVYDNVTGIAVGEWTRHQGEWEQGERNRSMNLTEISPDIDWAFESQWHRNITGIEGKMVLRIDEKHVEELNFDEHMDTKWNGAHAREVAATMTLQDETSSGDGWEMRVHGVHWPRTGVLLMTTTSDKFAGIFGLPHLSLSREYFDSSKQLLNKTLEKTIERIEKSNWIDPSNPWTSSPDSQGDAMVPAPHCEFVVHAQVHPISFEEPRWNGLQNLVSEIEQELRYPNGAPVPITPPLKLSTVIMSPDCGFLLESKGPPGFSPLEGNHLVGKKQELWLHDIEHWLVIFSAVCFSQVLLLKMQSKESSTPSTIGRVTSATSWSPPWRSAYVHLLSILYLSFWLPQIHRNAVRNCRKALLWKFIIGQSILRLLPFAYFFLKEDNMLFAKTDWKAFVVYAGWVWLQIWILVAQEILGPRWGVPKGWTEEGWDYHPILREDNVEAGGLPIGLVQIPGSPTLSLNDAGDSHDRKKKDGSFRSVDCSICMQVLEVPIVAAGEDSSSANGVTGIMARRLYMVTPCRHVFHSHCLEDSPVYYKP
ncbi:hypothetical protein BJ875DRAFT_527866 [Amylocarpus encephaloides]|uniref:RING-type E3 ubiquitin transferase n=1 Tax=Amylocarpus encephaloides TaxID=45428 RepID=A0A9P7YLX4_9HELO|nr:hypothetical protein BJ875DRAFT_527866 [Amylocarpus encephaloides]